MVILFYYHLPPSGKYLHTQGLKVFPCFWLNDIRFNFHRSKGVKLVTIGVSKRRSVNFAFDIGFFHLLSRVALVPITRIFGAYELGAVWYYVFFTFKVKVWGNRLTISLLRIMQLLVTKSSFSKLTYKKHP